MKKTLTFLMMVLLAAALIISCNNSTNEPETIPYENLVGTWIYGDAITGDDAEYISFTFNADKTASLKERKNRNTNDFSSEISYQVKGSTVIISASKGREWKYDVEFKDGKLVLKQVGDATWLEEFSNLKEIPLDRYYTITFNSNGGTTVGSRIFKTGTKITGVTAPTKGGFDFAGWKKGNADFNLETDTVNENMTLVAKWNYKTYVIGNSGPAGGTIFYVADSPVTTTYKDSAGNDVTYTWKYLEVAPATDAVSSLTFGSRDSSSSAAIGAGHSNTREIVNALGTTGNYAALKCDTYTKSQDGVAYDDWFLPSEGEFDKLYAARNSVTGFTAGYVEYWTSTEVNSYYARYGNNTNAGCSQTQRTDTKSVLPIRAF